MLFELIRFPVKGLLTSNWSNDDVYCVAQQCRLTRVTPYLWERTSSMIPYLWWSVNGCFFFLWRMVELSTKNAALRSSDAQIPARFEVLLFVFFTDSDMTWISHDRHVQWRNHAFLLESWKWTMNLILYSCFAYLPAPVLTKPPQTLQSVTPSWAPFPGEASRVQTFGVVTSKDRVREEVWSHGSTSQCFLYNTRTDDNNTTSSGHVTDWCDRHWLKKGAWLRSIQ